MALVIEDGSGVAGANSFVTAEEVIAYAATRGVEMTAEQAEVKAVEALDFFYTQCFSGEQLFELPFPRVGAILPNGSELPADAIPDGVKRAQAQLALDAHRGVKLVVSANAEPALKRKKIGPIEREYFAPGEGGIAPNVPQLPIAIALLAPYACGAAPFRVKTMRV